MPSALCFGCRAKFDAANHHCQRECDPLQRIHWDFCNDCQHHLYTWYEANWLVDQRMEDERKKREKGG